MPCIPDECYKKICTDTKTTVLLVVISVAILALLALSIYLVAKPVQCQDSPKPVVEYNRMNKHYDRKPSKCREGSILSFPQLTAIIEKNTVVHICSGAIVSKKWILTAAHCLISCNGLTCENYYIRAGSSYTNRGGKIYAIEQFEMHPEFSSTTLQNNIALIKVNGFEINDGAISYAKIYSTSIQPGKWVKLLGWAPYSRVDVLFRDNVLKMINLTIEPPVLCKYRLRNEYVKFTLTESMLCGTYPTAGGGCYTDAGGPLMRSGAVIGIAMFGQTCYSCPYHMSVATHVHYFIDFIKNFTVVKEIKDVLL